jgi:hypothetical protein
MSKKFGGLALATTVASMLWAPPALASPGWSAPLSYPLPSGAPASLTQIGYQQGGTATVAYLEVDSSSPPQTVLHVGVISPGGEYHEQLKVTTDSTSFPGKPELTVAPNGAAVLAWEAGYTSNPNNAYAYMASYRPAGSSAWETPTTIVPGSATLGGSPQVVPAISSDGTAAVGVVHLDPSSTSNYRIDVATHPASGSWGTATEISSAGQSSTDLALGFDSGDNLTASFRNVSQSTRRTIEVATRPASNGVWSSPNQIVGSSTTDVASAPELAVAPDGSAVIAFQYTNFSSTPNTNDATAVTRSGQSGSWSSAPIDLAPGAGNSYPTAVGESPDSVAYVLYWLQTTSSAGDCVGVVKAHTGGPFSAPQCISPSAAPPEGSGIAFRFNDAYFAWSAQPNGGPNYVVQGSRWLDFSSQPDAAIALDQSAPNEPLQQVVSDQDGSVAAFWSTSSTTLRAAAYDFGGPNVVSTSIPITAGTGRPVTVSIKFADLWSGLSGSPSWNFGDNTPDVSGTTVTHTYSHPGTYFISVSATDGLGNQSSANYRITVKKPPRLTKVKQSAKRWTKSAGDTFSFKLSENATITLVFTKKHSKHPAGRESFTRKAGRNKVHFHGSLPRHRRLGPGTYTVTIEASNAFGSTRKSLIFTIVP